MILEKAFPGRVIFDHLPKTAGQAINAWLVDVLGTGCVTPNLIGHHGDLIRQYGGQYSIISAHVEFHAREGFDPRYQYMTFFREPSDRVVSWLYFVVNNHDDAQLPELRASAKCFLDSEGLDVADLLIGHISNVYVEHFCRINGSGLESDDEKIANALAVIKQYDVVGVYQDMPRFLADVAALIGIPKPQEIARVNVTTKRPQVDRISDALRARIIELNQLDLRLYAEVVAWRASIVQNESIQTPPLNVSKWKKYEAPIRVYDRVVTTPDISIVSAVLRDGVDICHGQLMSFDVDFFLGQEMQDLEMGIHIFDSEKQWAFGTNSTLLGQSHKLSQQGLYRVSHHLIADLPAGKYTAGFAFAERRPEGNRELAWYDVMCEFQVCYKVNKPFAGYSYLPADISLNYLPMPTNYRIPADDSRLLTEVGMKEGDRIVGTGQAGFLIFGPYIPLAAGQYYVLIHCVLGENGFAGARMDVVAERGNRIFTDVLLDESLENGGYLKVPISLDSPCNDLEIRIFVTNQSALQISAIEIVPWQFDETNNLINNPFVDDVLADTSDVDGGQV